LTVAGADPVIRDKAGAAGDETARGEIEILAVVPIERPGERGVGGDRRRAGDGGSGEQEGDLDHGAR